MKILVTGGTGFIGSHLTKALRERHRALDDEVYTVSRHRHPDGQHGKGYFFHAPIGSDNMGHCQMDVKHITLDLSDRSAVLRMMQVFQPDVIYHLAANPLTRMDKERPFQIMHDNVLSTQYLCEYAPQGCRFFLASSIVVYGDYNGEVCGELDVTSPTSLYAVTKLASEGVVSVYTQLGKIKGTCLRLCATVGSGVTHGIIYDFIKKLRSDSPTLEVLGAWPGSRKPYIHVDDVVSAFLSADDHYGLYNICASDAIPVAEIAQLVKDTLGINKPNTWLGSESTWKGDNKTLWANNSLAKQEFWQPKFIWSASAIEQAILDIIEDE